MHADEVFVDDDLVRALVSEQHPKWAGLALRRMSSTGTDNAIYRLGDQLGIRLPRIHWAVHQVERERQWLPCLAPQLPAAVPVPIATGEPGCGYPFPWLVYSWLPGVDALAVGAAQDWCALALEVAAFVASLQRIDVRGAPSAPGPRAGSLAPHDAATRQAISALSGEIDVDGATRVWDMALAADGRAGSRVWVHGDLLPGNIVVRHGRLAGVIDWSATGIGDPACDLMLGWAMPPEARATYFDALHSDAATRARARGWVVEQAVRFIPYYAATIPSAVAAARDRLDAAIDSDES